MDLVFANHHAHWITVCMHPANYYRIFLLKAIYLPGIM